MSLIKKLSTKGNVFVLTVMMGLPGCKDAREESRTNPPSRDYTNELGNAYQRSVRLQEETPQRDLWVEQIPNAYVQQPFEKDCNAYLEGQEQLYEIPNPARRK